MGEAISTEDSISPGPKMRDADLIARQIRSVETLAKLMAAEKI
jgi:hypothetical protein